MTQISTMSFSSYKISRLNRIWRNKVKLMQLREWDIWCSQWHCAATWLMVFTWSGMASLFHSLTGLWCLPPFLSGPVFAQPTTQLTSEKTLCWHQRKQFTCNQSTIYFTPWQLFATLSSWLSTGSSSERSNKTFTLCIKSTDGEDPSI